MDLIDLQSIDVSGSKILIVDDQSENITILSGILADEGYEVVAAESGEQAIEMVGIHLPDVILMDILMPGLDGVATCKRIKENSEFQSIPVIFVTAANDPENLVKAFNCGAADYINKPVTREEVSLRIKNQLMLSMYHRALVATNESLQAMLDVDELTGIPNRHFHEVRFRQEWNRMMREAGEMSVVYVDIDYFKRYNDHFGHSAGDNCLKRTARRIMECLRRPGDYVARIGGEEFVVVLPQTDLGGAIYVAEQIRKGVQQLGMKHPQSDAAEVVTVCCGVVSAAPKRHLKPQSFIDAADQALYKAKEQGRNQVASIEFRTLLK